MAEDRAPETGRAGFRLLFATNPLPMWVVDVETLQFLEVNEAAVAQYGFSRDEFLAMRIHEIRPEADVPRLLAEVARMQPGYGAAGEWRHRRKDGTVIDVQITRATLEFHGRRAMLVVAQDITARKRAEDEQMRLAAIVASSDDAIFSKTLDGTIVSWNAGAERMYGYTAAEAIGRPVSVLAPPDRPGEIPEILRRLKRGEHVVHLETERIRKNGARIQVSLTVSPIKNAAGTVVGASATARDITERKRGEEERARLFDDLRRSNVELALAYESALEAWSRALDLRDKETEGHTQRVAEMALRLARAFGVSEAELVQIRRGALLHDIGKMGIPDSILLKAGPLTEEEREVMRRHPIYAYEFLSRITYLRPALEIPYYHHEKWDGTGYPQGLAGEQIPLAARIFAVVDVWDALRSQRPYRPGWTHPKVITYIRDQAGKHFDPHVVEAFLHLEAQQQIA